jgi:cyclase
VVKKRIIPKFLLKNGRLFKGVGFHEQHREAGNPVTAAKVYDSYGSDELIFLDTDGAAASARTIDIVERVSREVFMPLTVGGGVRTLDDIHALLRAGADKVSINTAAVADRGLVAAAARTFGDQCITVSIDYREVDGRQAVFTAGGSQRTDLDPVEWALRMQDAHCGDILLSSIDRDGRLSGFDVDTIARAAARLEVPLIGSSGAGSLQHCIDAFQAGADAIAIGSLFFFTDHSPIKVRSYLWSKGIDVRASASSRN